MRPSPESLNQPEYDNPEDGFPLVGWVSGALEAADVNLMDATIEGELNPANPGSVVDGTSTWEMRSPEGFTMTITWHLVHDGPIVLPQF